MTITEEKVEDFLEHFGVKGMKWGVRKKRPHSPMTKEQKERRKKQVKVAAVIGATAAVAAGALVARDMVKQYGGVKVGSVPKAPAYASAREALRSYPSREATREVARTASGAIPMPAGRMRPRTLIGGSTLIKDLPKNTKITDLTPDLQRRVRMVQNRMRSAPTPEALGIWKPNI